MSNVRIRRSASTRPAHAHLQSFSVSNSLLRPQAIAVSALCATACALALGVGLSASNPGVAGAHSDDLESLVLSSVSYDEALEFGLLDTSGAALLSEDGVSEASIEVFASAEAQAAADTEGLSLTINPSQEALAESFMAAGLWSDDAQAAENAALQVATGEKLDRTIVIADLDVFGPYEQGAKTFSFDVASLSGGKILAGDTVVLRNLCSAQGDEKLLVAAQAEQQVSSAPTQELVVGDDGIVTFSIDCGGVYALGEANRVNALVIDPLNEAERARVASLGVVADELDTPDNPVDVPPSTSDPQAPSQDPASEENAPAPDTPQGESDASSFFDYSEDPAGSASAVATPSSTSVALPAAASAMPAAEEAAEAAGEAADAQDASSTFDGSESEALRSSSSQVAQLPEKSQASFAGFFLTEDGEVDSGKVAAVIGAALLALAALGAGIYLFIRHRRARHAKEVAGAVAAAGEGSQSSSKGVPVEIAGAPSMKAAASACKAAASSAA